MKKITATITAGLAVIIGIISPLSVSAEFGDVPNTHPNYDAVTYLQTFNYVHGYADGSYQPEREISRGEFTKIIFGVANDVTTLEACTTKPFPDVELDNKFLQFICKAKNTGIINGFTDGTFRPDSTITISEASKIIVRSFNPDFVENTTDSWKKQYIDDLSLKNAIPESLLHLEEAVTRGEMAEIAYRVKANITDRPSRNYQQLFDASVLLQDESVWMYFNPRQCESPPWKENPGDQNDFAPIPEYEEIMKYYRNHGIEIQKVTNISDPNVNVCTSCSCLTGESFYIYIETKYVERMRLFGWTLSETKEPPCCIVEN